jgi:hypothetical protein
MHRWLALLFVLTLTLSALGCGGSEPDDPKEPRPEDLRTPKGLQPLEPVR